MFWQILKGVGVFISKVVGLVSLNARVDEMEKNQKERFMMEIEKGGPLTILDHHKLCMENSVNMINSFKIILDTVGKNVTDKIDGFKSEMTLLIENKVLKGQEELVKNVTDKIDVFRSEVHILIENKVLKGQEELIAHIIKSGGTKNGKRKNVR
jgi:hypothetical protein